MDSSSSSGMTPSKPRQSRAGRPPRVNAQAIIGAALEIGLENVTLKQVADRLGVAMATLYRHVRNRDDMVRLAAFQLMLQRRIPQQSNGHWTELATRYAETLYETFLAEPQLIGQLLKGELGPHAEVDVLEHFIGAMAKHGFNPLEGAQLFHAIGMITIGAAAGAIGQASAEAAGMPWHQATKNVLAERGAAELHQVRRVLPLALSQKSIPWQPTLQLLLAGIAQQRGEKLP